MCALTELVDVLERRLAQARIVHASAKALYLSAPSREHGDEWLTAKGSLNAYTVALDDARRALGKQMKGAA